jgi:DNA-directed RNA polymerase, mitochondrial
MADLNKELLWEKSMLDRGIQKYHKAVYDAQYGESISGGVFERSNEASTSYGNALIKKYFMPVEAAIDHLILTSSTNRGKSSTAATYLSACDSREVAYLAIRCILDVISKKTRLSNVANRIGSHIEDHMRLCSFDSTHPKYYKTVTNMLERSNVTDYSGKKKLFVVCHKKAANVEEAIAAGNRYAEKHHLTSNQRDQYIAEIVAKAEDARWVPWSQKDKANIGGTLIQLIILATSDYSNGLTAADNKYKEELRVHGSGLIERITITMGNSLRNELIYATDRTIKFIKNNMQLCEAMHPEFLPTLVPPKRWTTPLDGGYWDPHMRQRKPLVKTGSKHRKILKKAHMPTVYNAVNTAQEVPWTINRAVLNEALLQFRAPAGVGMPGNIVEELPECPVSAFSNTEGMNPKAFREYKRSVKASMTKDEKTKYAKWAGICRQIYVNENKRKSKIIGVSSVLRVAKMLSDKDEFYFVHTLDYRSRMYACGTGVNPQGIELSKALLKFKRGTKLGKHGLWHALLHAAGLAGVDKVSPNDRVKWAIDNANNIIRSGLVPSDMTEFWGNADKPYMFLAVCEELSRALAPVNFSAIGKINKEALSGIQADFISHLSGNQDGSCNGIQHCSALLKDPVGAKATNMYPSTDEDLPEDIYNMAADLVIQELSDNLESGVARNGNSLDAVGARMHKLLSQVLEVIDRKTTKRSTMIVPYGGTKRSCLTYVKEWVTKVNEKDGKWSAYDVDDISLVLHHYVWSALDTVVVAARVVMGFLRDCMKINCKLGVPMLYVTPSGFPVLQDIKNSSLREVDLRLYGRMRVSYIESTDDLNKYKMSSSFSPNFVHSMDATHLMFTVNASKAVGIEDFALVHDSYGVPFGHVELFHRIIREAFIGMYSHNVLVGFLKQQLAQFPDMEAEYPDESVIAGRGFDINLVAKAKHFFL